MAQIDKQISRIGVISDTHGLLRPAVIREFQGVKSIFHAGDVGDIDVVNELSLIAPVYAVRGNMDRGEVFEVLPSTLLRDSWGVSIYMLHDLLKLDINPIASEVDIVIHGHTHQASIEQRDEIWYINPGCAGPNPKESRASVCLIDIMETSVQPRILSL
jgi:putative phosphoesterase